MAELLVSIEMGSYVRPKRVSVGQYLEQWLQGYVATNTAPRTRERYEEIAPLQLIPALGSLPLSALQLRHIQKYYAEALESGRRDGKDRVLYEALRHAVKHGIIFLQGLRANLKLGGVTERLMAAVSKFKPFIALVLSRKPPNL